MSNAPRWSTAIFDLDGTLCDTIALIVASYQHAHREVLGVELTAAEIRPWIGRTLGDVYAAWPEHAAALEASYLTWNLANLERLQTGYDGMPELLGDLVAAGAKVGVATSKRRESARRSLAAAGLEQLIPVVCASDDTLRHKPDPEPLLKAAELVGVDPTTCVYLGDAVVDVQAAKAAGMAQVAVTWGAGDRTDLMLENPTAVVDTMDELRRWLLDDH